MDQQPFENSTQFKTNFEQSPSPVPPPAKTNGYAVASLVLGIVSLVFSCCCNCVVPVTAILGIVFAVVSKKGKPMNGMALGGMICSIIALAILVFCVAFLMVNPGYMEEFEQAFWEGFEAGYYGN